MSGFSTQMLGYYRNNDGKIDLKKAAAGAVQQGNQPGLTFSQAVQEISSLVGSNDVAKSQSSVTTAYSGVRQQSMPSTTGSTAANYNSTKVKDDSLLNVVTTSANSYSGPQGGFGLNLIV